MQVGGRTEQPHKAWAAPRYGQQPNSLLSALKTTRFAGYSDDQVSAMLAGTANALADGRELPEPTTPLGKDTLSQSMQLARIHQYLSMATPLLWMRQPDTIGVLGLAINTCAERNGHVEALEQIEELLVAARDLWTEVPSLDEAGQFVAGRLTHRLIHLADIEVVTA